MISMLWGALVCEVFFRKTQWKAHSALMSFPFISWQVNKSGWSDSVKGRGTGTLLRCSGKLGHCAGGHCTAYCGHIDTTW